MAYAGFFPTKDNKAKLEKAVQKEIKRLTQSDAPSLAPTGKESPRNKYIRKEALRQIKTVNKQKSITEKQAQSQTNRKFAPKESRGRPAQGNKDS
jgi:hypothetical protein